MLSRADMLSGTIWRHAQRCSEVHFWLVQRYRTSLWRCIMASVTSWAAHPVCHTVSRTASSFRTSCASTWIALHLSGLRLRTLWVFRLRTKALDLLLKRLYIVFMTCSVR